MHSGIRLVAVTLVCTAAMTGVSWARVFSLDERVDAQRRIEQVYWKHREWPSQNSTPKPALDAIVTDETLRQRVEDYLKKSVALETTWKRPIIPVQLQAEIDRISTQS